MVITNAADLHTSPLQWWMLLWFEILEPVLISLILWLVVFARTFHRHRLAQHSAWSFRDFIQKCVIYEFERGGVAGMEPHWRPQYAVGAFCDLKYDFIGVYKSINALSLLLSLNQFLIYSSLLYLLNFWILQLPTFVFVKLANCHSSCFPLISLILLNLFGPPFQVCSTTCDL